MRDYLEPRLRLSRVHVPALAHEENEHNGLFQPVGPEGRRLGVIVSDGDGWDHASVSVIGKPQEVPTYAEMCFIKRLVWRDDETVMELHVPISEHINNHAGCLHLWRPQGAEIPRPPNWMVGIRGVTVR